MTRRTAPSEWPTCFSSEGAVRRSIGDPRGFNNGGSGLMRRVTRHVPSGGTSATTKTLVGRNQRHTIGQWICQKSFVSAAADDARRLGTSGSHGRRRAG